MNKVITTIALVLGLMFFAFVPVKQVIASSDECTEVPGPYGSVGPYGSRICDTGIIFSDLGMSIPTEAGIGLAGLFAFGSIFVVNGKILKARLN